MTPLKKSRQQMQKMFFFFDFFSCFFYDFFLKFCSPFFCCQCEARLASLEGTPVERQRLMRHGAALPNQRSLEVKLGTFSRCFWYVWLFQPPLLVWKPFERLVVWQLGLILSAKFSECVHVKLIT